MKLVTPMDSVSIHLTFEIHLTEVITQLLVVVTGLPNPFYTGLKKLII